MIACRLINVQTINSLLKLNKINFFDRCNQINPKMVTYYTCTGMYAETRVIIRTEMNE